MQAYDRRGLCNLFIIFISLLEEKQEIIQDPNCFFAVMNASSSNLVAILLITNYHEITIS